jgi:hypothetical protein
MLVETPAVHLDELTDAERDWLRSRQRREAQAVSELLCLEKGVPGPRSLGAMAFSRGAVDNTASAHSG